MTLVEQARAAAAPAPALDDDLLSGAPWRRHPVDIARLVIASLALALTAGLALRHPGEVRSVSVDLVDAVSGLPGWLTELLLGTTQLLAVAVPVAMIAKLTREPRLLVTACGAAAVAGVAMARLQSEVDAAVPNRVQLVNYRPSWVLGAAFPSGAYLAAFAAVIVVLGPVLSRTWRVAAAVGLALGMLSRVLTAVAVPLNLAITAALGAVVGSAALAAFGSPRRHASRRAVLEGLRRAGARVDDLVRWDVGARNAELFRATAVGRPPSVVKLVGRDERSADLLFRAIRTLRVKDLDDERPAWTPAHLVEHEAFTGLLAGSAGVRTAPVLAVGATAGGDGVLALGLVPGRPLSQLDAGTITDEVLAACWAQLAALHGQGIAHRWSTTEHLVLDVDAEGAPVVTVLDFRWAQHQASPEAIAADVAMLVVSLAASVGVDRAVASAAAALPALDLARALPLVQPLALPDDVRRAASADPELLERVRTALQEAAGGAPYRLADIERVGPRQVASLLGGALLVWVLLTFASNWPDMQRALGGLDAGDVPVIVVLAALSYVTGAVALAAVTPKRVPLWEAVKVQLAQSFLNRFTPANAGGMALRIRYLQKRGVDLGGAAAGVALTSVASAICQVIVFATFAVWAGRGAGLAFSFPKASTIALAGLGVAVLAGVVWLTPFGRRVIASRIETTARQVWTTLIELTASPARFVALFGSTLLGKAANLAAFAACCDALGLAISVPRLGFLYLTASTVAAAAPTPGGVGAVEAALTAALTGAGAPPADALSAVFVFRLATYWLPVPFGWAAMHRLRGTVLN